MPPRGRPRQPKPPTNLVRPEPEPTPTHHVKFRVSAPLLHQILRLGRDTTIVDVTYDPATSIVEITLDAPGAPKGASEMLVTYAHTGGRDPIFVRSVDWKFPERVESPVRSLPIKEDAA